MPLFWVVVFLAARAAFLRWVERVFTREAPA